jgi:transcriptional regulator GlxA family with amidase domain
MTTPHPTPAPFDIVFALYPNITQLDFTGPFEVFQRMPGARIRVASRQGGLLRTDSGLVFAGLEQLADIPSCDLICVPGGLGLTATLLDAEFMTQVRRLGQSARYVTSVCTGSLVLAAAGLLEGRRATCHWAWRELLAETGVQVESARVVRDGNFITSGGVSAGVDFALTVVAEIAGVEVAQGIQLFIEYAPEPPFEGGTPDRAAPAVLARTRESALRLLEERRSALHAAIAARVGG